MIKSLPFEDQRCLEAAQGWFELGNHLEAKDELDQITPEMRGHPSVLEVRFHIYAAAKEWEYAAEIARAISDCVPDNPFGFIHQAYSLHELKQTREAWNVLLPVADKFPKEYIIRYNLACYACQLGNLNEARDWLKHASDLIGTNQVKLLALEDADLEPLWKEIGG
ncbi:MAG: tetratricopeptide repeat protein [Verrucomicrobia bacterium]|nr:tetratricopeptide repeat protein [Verrucomicrobiota bacterium]